MTMREFGGVPVTRHDLSLLTIAAALLVGTVVGLLSPVGLSQSLFLSSVPAVCSVGYALFYRPPEKES
jgi:hypothetical protein